MFRKWLVRSYVRISELNDVDAAERRRVNRLWHKQNYVRISELNDVDAAERKQKQRLYYAANKKKQKIRVATRGQSPAAAEATRRYQHKYRQDKREAAHTKNKMKGEFVREVYVPKELTSCS